MNVRRRRSQYPREYPDAQEALRERAEATFYKVEWYVDKGSGERSDPWLIWNPPKDRWDFSEKQKIQEFVEKRILKTRKLSPDFFLGNEDFPSKDFPSKDFPSKKDEELFRPRRFYGGPEKRRSKLKGTVDDLASGELAADGSVPVSEVARLKSTRDEAWDKLNGYIDDLQNGVLEPLRKVLIACLLEQYRDRIGLGNWQECDRSLRKKWERTVELAHRLLKELVVRGRPLNIIQTDERWVGKMSTRLFGRLPEAVAKGLRAAFQHYVTEICIPEGEVEKVDPTDYSRDGVLKRAEPVYFKWRAADLMVDSAVEDEKLEIGGQDYKPKDSEPKDDKTEQKDKRPTEDEAPMQGNVPSPSENERNPLSSESDEEDWMTEERRKDLLSNLDIKKHTKTYLIIEAVNEVHINDLYLYKSGNISGMIMSALRKSSVLKDRYPSEPRDSLSKFLKKKGVYEELWPTEVDDKSKKASKVLNIVLLIDRYN